MLEGLAERDDALPKCARAHRLDGTTHSMGSEKSPNSLAGPSSGGRSGPESPFNRDFGLRPHHTPRRGGGS